MTNKPTYEELELRIKELEAKNLDRKLIEDSLIKSEEKCRLLSEGTFEAVVWHHKGKIIEANKQYYEMFGYKPEELINKDAILLTAASESVEFMRKQIAFGNLGPYEVVGLKKDGTEFPMEIRAKVMEHKGIKARMAAIRDLTERKQVEEALRKSEERYRAIAENSRVGFWHIDLDGYALYMNPALCQMLEVESPEELSGQTWESFFDDKNREIIKRELAKREKGISSSYEVELISTKGTKRNVIISGSPQFIFGKKLHSTLGTLTDITDKKKAEKALMIAHSELEKRVEERTRELEIKTQNLEEANVALNVLLDKRQEDKKETSDNLLTNIEELIVPYLEKIKKTKLDVHQKTILSIIESNLGTISSSFARKMSRTYLNLTPIEIKVANLIRHGNTSKEISQIMNLSPRTIYNHRKNIRKKLGLKNRKTDLRSYLLSIY